MGRWKMFGCCEEGEEGEGERRGGFTFSVSRALVLQKWLRWW